MGNTTGTRQTPGTGSGDGATRKRASGAQSTAGQSQPARAVSASANGKSALAETLALLQDDLATLQRYVRVHVADQAGVLIIVVLPDGERIAYNANSGHITLDGKEVVGWTDD